jgi:hypothetical protein
MNWEARYNDGTVLPKFNDDGSENRYEDIDRGKLESFALFMEIDGVNHPAIELHLDPGQNLIYRRRVEKRSDGVEFVVYLVGWKMQVGGETVQSIAYISEAGEVHLAGKWRDNHPWFYAIQPVVAEEESK